MKFSDVDKGQWEHLRPYLDTCVFPVTGLGGDEPPWKTADILTKLGAMLDSLDKHFKGRVVIYPAVHYSAGFSDMAAYVDGLCRKAKEGGFRYAVLAAVSAISFLAEVSEADLILQRNDEEEIRRQMEALWLSGKESEAKV